VTYLRRLWVAGLYRMSQEEISIFWEVIVSVMLRKMCVCTCVLFRTVSEIELFHCTAHCTQYRRATRHVLTRVAKCIDVDCGNFENVLYNVNCRTCVTWTINASIRNSTKYLFVVNTFGIIQWNNCISETVRNRTHVRIHFFLLRITDTITSQSPDLSSRDIPCSVE
jgi:hypothetical protein